MWRCFSGKPLKRSLRESKIPECAWGSQLKKCLTNGGGGYIKFKITATQSFSEVHPPKEAHPPMKRVRLSRINIYVSSCSRVYICGTHQQNMTKGWY